MRIGGLAAAAAAAALLLTACTTDQDSAEQPVHGPTTVAEAPATLCADALEDTRVEGDLLVPAGKSCRLRNVQVDGRTSVGVNASLTARATYFGEGVGAHGFKAVSISGDDAPRDYAFDPGRGARVRDYVFSGGRSLRIRGADMNGAYLVKNMSGRVEISRMYLDLGSVLCLGNARTPRVSGISAETPSKLQGQCAGGKGFDPGSDF